MDSMETAIENSERTLAALWQKAHTLPDGLVTQDGRRFRVVYPGKPNPRAGPDFHNAVISTEAGDLITGDVELHLNAPDWYRHRHHDDPGYNGVVLHVVLWPRGKAASRQESGTSAPVVSIAHDMPTLSRGEASDIDALAQLKALDRNALCEALERAGDERFHARSRGFALELTEADPQQALYGALMEALGYASNRKPFRELARRAPIATLMELRREPPSTRLLALKAMLLGASGLLSFVKPPEEAAQMERLTRRLPRVRAMSASDWHLFRVRPANHPAMRVIGAAYLIDRYIASGLVRGLEQDVLSGDAAHLTGRLEARPFIGRGRAGEMAVNVALPFMHAYAGIKGSPDMSRHCIGLYQRFPGLEDNEVTREMARLLALEAGAKELSSARCQQGLIHLYKTLVRPSKEHTEESTDYTD
jgi:hypothetical protein